MTPLSTRCLPGLLALLLVAAVPIWFTTLRHPRWDECRQPDALRDMDRIAGSRTLQERPEHYRRSIFQWTEGEILDEPSGTAILESRVIRAEVGADLYNDPSAFLGMSLDWARARRAWISEGGDRLPVHLVDSSFADSAGRFSGVAAYLFVYDGRPVDFPLPMQLATAVPQLWKGRRPLTLFVVLGVARRGQEAAFEPVATRWLRSAWRSYRELCLP